MTNPAGNVERRVVALEQEVARLQVEVDRVAGDAAAARDLAGGAESEVSAMRQELRAHTRLLSALRETQLEQGDRLTGRVDGLEAEMRRGFATMNEGMHQIVELLEQRG